METLPAAVTGRLRAELGTGGMYDFGRAVVRQLAPARGAVIDEMVAAGMLLDLIRSARTGRVEAVTAAFLSNPPLFASVFQNLDLLFEVRGTAADTLAEGVLEAVRRADERDAK